MREEIGTYSLPVVLKILLLPVGSFFPGSEAKSSLMSTIKFVKNNTGIIQISSSPTKTLIIDVMAVIYYIGTKSVRIKTFPHIVKESTARRAALASR